MLLSLGFRSLSPMAKRMDVARAMMLLTRALPDPSTASQNLSPEQEQNRNRPQKSGYGKG